MVMMTATIHHHHDDGNQTQCHLQRRQRHGQCHQRRQHKPTPVPMWMEMPV